MAVLAGAGGATGFILTLVEDYELRWLFSPYGWLAALVLVPLAPAAVIYWHAKNIRFRKVVLFLGGYIAGYIVLPFIMFFGIIFVMVGRQFVNQRPFDSEAWKTLKDAT